MTKKQQQSATVDDEREPVSTTGELVNKTSPSLGNLMMSGIVTYHDGVVTFRAGHLERLALEYVRDPVATWRDYHDDMEVVQMYCLEQWDKLINGELH